VLRTYWPSAKLQSILDTAEELGERKVLFRTLSDAKRFRFACYNLRRRKKATNRLTFELNPNDCSILIQRTPTIQIEEKSPQ
jgi:hypothetical protein